ncbi:hypothetical protein MPSEU_000420400 [Mayamaea pseudoterrestris]|nr:hypothetical protein MPSEU_000420400 [Mayamaea pseudoterrestris]
MGVQRLNKQVIFLLLLSFLLRTNHATAFVSTRQSAFSQRVSLLISTKSDAATAQASGMKLIQGISDIINDYDVFLLDMWGVLHDGNRPYVGVLDTLQTLKHKHPNKRLIIISNSSKRKQDSILALEKLGFDPSHFEQIITSGELTHQMLLEQHANADLSWMQTNTASETTSLKSKQEQLPPSPKLNSSPPSALILGSGDADVEYCQSAGWSLANVEQASLLLARGTFTISDGSGNLVDKRIDEAQYDEVMQNVLQRAAQRKLPMLVSNPDKVRPDVGLPPMPGKLGDMYEAALRMVTCDAGDSAGNAADGDASVEQLVKRIGKPFLDVYHAAIGANVERSRTIMIGDALETDVTGGSAAGLATLWILKTGIHGSDLPDDDALLEAGAANVLDVFNQRTNTYAKGRVLAPDYIMPSFQW